MDMWWDMEGVEVRDIWDVIHEIEKDIEDNRINLEDGISLLEDLLDASSEDEIADMLYDAGYLVEEEEVDIPEGLKEFKKKLRKLVRDLRYRYKMYGIWLVIGDILNSLSGEMLSPFDEKQAKELLVRLSKAKDYDEVDKILHEIGYLDDNDKLDRGPGDKMQVQRELREAQDKMKDILYNLERGKHYLTEPRPMVSAWSLVFKIEDEIADAVRLGKMDVVKELLATLRKMLDVKSESEIKKLFLASHPYYEDIVVEKVDDLTEFKKELEERIKYLEEKYGING